MMGLRGVGVVKVIDGEPEPGEGGEGEGRAKMGLMGVMGGWRRCGEEGEAKEGRAGSLVGGRQGGGWVRLSAVIGGA